MQVRVEIVRFVDDYQPGFVEAVLLDARGRGWRFVDKVPIFTRESLDAGSSYPRPGMIACEVIREWRDEDGRELCTIDTSKPDGVEASGGESVFDVPAARLAPR